jgi:predicted nucleic acid-binding protein
LIKPEDPGIQWMHEAAVALFDRASRGELMLTTSESVFAEITFVLMSRSHYSHSAADTCAHMLTLIANPGLEFPGKLQVSLAISLWMQRPALGFVDALMAAHALTPGNQLASFDAVFERMPEIDRLPWSPGKA